MHIFSTSPEMLPAAENSVLKLALLLKPTLPCVLDGTRITTGYTIEEEPVICDWTEEEIQRYFASEWTKGEEGYVSVPRLKQTDGDSPRSSAEYESDTTDIDEILIADGFVSVLLTCRAEHKKYATVFYGQSAVSCALSMPDDLRVSISRSGHYEVSMADGVNLKVIGTRGMRFAGDCLVNSETSPFAFERSELSKFSQICNLRSKPSARKFYENYIRRQDDFIYKLK